MAKLVCQSCGNEFESRYEESVCPACGTNCIADKSEKAERPAKAEKRAKKQARKDKKQARRDKKTAKRNAKIDRQQKNNTGLLLGGVAFLGIICAALFFMFRFGLTYTDLPEVFRGEMRPWEETTNAPVFMEPATSDANAPVAGAYIVASENGISMYESASATSRRVAVIANGTLLNMTAFKYNEETESYWGRTSVKSDFGWVNMTSSNSRKQTAPKQPRLQNNFPKSK